MALELMQYLRLIRDTPVDELDELLVQIERELPGDYPGDLLRERVADLLVDKNPEEAYALLMSGRSAFFSKRRSSAVIRRLAELDLDGTFERVASLPSASRRLSFLGTLVEFEARKDPAAALTRIAGLPPHEREKMLQQLARNERLPPEFSFGIAEQLQNPQEAQKRLASLTGHWARRDPEAALTRLNQLKSQANLAKSIEALGSGWASKELDEAVEYAEQIDSPKMRAKFLSGVAAAALDDIFDVGRDRVEEIVATIDDESVRRQFEANIEKRTNRTRSSRR